VGPRPPPPPPPDLHEFHFVPGANRMHGRGGAKWAAVPSLTLMERKISHASSQR